MDNTYINESGCVPVKLFLKGGGQPMGHRLPIPALEEDKSNNFNYDVYLLVLFMD